MDTALKEMLWKQFGASIDMLENALSAYPNELWNNGSDFWHRAYHTLFFLDYFLTEEPAGFLPPQPFSLSELDPSGAMPERIYTKDELLSYTAHCRQKCHDLIAGLSAERAAVRWVNEYRNYSMLELLLYNMRHVQHHTAQLNLLLRQGIDNAPAWVAETAVEL